MTEVISFDREESLDSPQVVHRRLLEIENDLAIRQNTFEQVAGDWFRAQREQGRTWARALLSAKQPTVTAAKAEADLAAFDVDGTELGPEYEATKAVLKVLENRAVILMSILKSQGRV